MGNPYYTWGTPTILNPPPDGLGANPRWTVAANKDGHLEVFALGQNGAVWHTWQNYRNIYEWSEWASLGAPGALTNLAYSIQAVQNEDGRIELFVADDEWNVWHIWQLAPNANWIGKWSSLGRPILPQSTNDAYSIAVSPTDGGTIAVLMQNLGSNSSGEVFSRSQTEKNGNWELAWTSLGPVKSDLAGFAIACPPKSLLTQVAGIDAGFGDTRTLFVNRKSSFVVGAANWSGWTEPFGGPLGIQSLGSLVFQRNDDNHLELFGYDFNTGDIWHIWQANGAWTQPWANLGSPTKRNLGNFSCSLGPDGLIYVVIWGADDNAIHVINQTAKNNGWGNWSTLWKNDNPNPIPNDVAVLELIQDQDGLLNVFGQDSAKRLFYIRQVFHKG